MIETFNIPDWYEVVDLLGHSSKYNPLKKFVADAMKKDLAKSRWWTNAGLMNSAKKDFYITFAFWNDKEEYNEEYLLPTKDDDDKNALVSIEVTNKYEGNLPFGLSFSFARNQAVTALKDFHLQDSTMSDGKVRSSVFYYKLWKLIIIVFYNRKSEEAHIDAIRFIIPSKYDIKNYNLNI